MTDRDWQHAWEIFRTARELDATALSAYLDSIQTDPDLLREVIAMLEEPPEEPPPEPGARLGARLGRYEIIDILGAGAMGVVYSALDQELGRMVAIKFVTAGSSGSPRAVDRLISEARAASALNHPNIITVYDAVGQEDDVALVMELVEGKTLRQLCANLPEFPILIEWSVQIARALAAAHQRNILHRDIKPENVMVRHDGLIKVLDFGLARDSRSLNTSAITDHSPALSGTLSYMAPEQVLGERSSSASDIFSLGVVLFELATGSHPFRKDSPLGTAQEIAVGEPTKPSTLRRGLPPSLDRLLLAMLDKSASRRPSAPEVAHLLESIRPQREGLLRTGPSRSVRQAAIWGATLAFLAGILWLSARYLRPTAIHKEFRVRPLTSQDGWEGSPALSPNGDVVAFTWRETLTSPKQIYVRNLKSEMSVRVASQEHDWDIGSLAWSPDGKRIAFKRWGVNPGIYTVSSSGGGEQMIAPVKAADPSSAVDWSPDGKQLAFTDNPVASGAQSVYLLNLTTGRRRKLTSSVGGWGDWDPKFSPDGQTIAFKRVGGYWLDDLYTIPASGGEAKRITSWQRGIWGYTWSSDGTSLVASSQATGTVFGIVRFPISHPERWEYLTRGSSTDAITPTSGRHTDRLAWVSQTENLNIYRMDAAGAGKPQKLIASVARDRSARYSPDGRIAFISDRAGNSELWLSDSEGRRQTRVRTSEKVGGVGGVGALDWSPDGTQIAFSAALSGKLRIFLIACPTGGLQCGQARQFTNSAAYDFDPEWSSDGRFLYFTSVRTGGHEIWRQPLNGGPPVQITRNGGYVCRESADGQWLYFSQWDSPVIWRIPGSRSPQSRDLAPEIVIGARYPVKAASWTLTSDDIFFMDVDQLAHPRSAIISAFHLSSGKVRTISERMFTDRRENPLSVSPDRRWLLYTYLDHFGGNIMVTEGGP